MSTYVAWAVLYEGETDAAYYDVLIPRVMEEMVIAGTKLPTIPTAPAVRFTRGSSEKVAAEACAASEAFHLVFIHADTGGRSLEAGMGQRSTDYCQAMNDRCEWPMPRCIVIAPRHETEAWILADPQAVTSTLGYSGAPAAIGLPANAAAAERLADPKAVLHSAIVEVRGRRRAVDVTQVFPAIAQRQRLEELRRARSFQVFEDHVRRALNDLGCL
ncbi:DUF4276 family protein [Caulobacter sp. 602-2]|uniref:DUF4276 family protein n=1 Tax=Caulobacter sp. 602-2 TaxID=2710887 RepID=A0A6G4R134_9CAUL|nr:DUF4276 family protein [Caulobacter sp. 602-2]NGM51205.1 DUF4276 family protein [Caulobacter sp. 602-2]